MITIDTEKHLKNPVPIGDKNFQQTRTGKELPLHDKEHL